MAIKLIILALCIIASVVLSFSGLVLVVLGLTRKNKRRVRNGILGILLAFCLLVGSSSYVTVKVYKRLSTITWARTVIVVLDFVFDVLTTVEQVSADEVMLDLSGEPAPPGIRNFQGVRADFPGFDTYYLRYNAEKSLVLDMVSSMPFVDSSLSSDSACKEESWGYERLKSDLEPRPEVLDDVPFWNPDELEEKEYYTCLKFPWDHIIVFDKSSDIVYHKVSEIRE